MIFHYYYLEYQYSNYHYRVFHFYSIIILLLPVDPSIVNQPRSLQLLVQLSQQRRKAKDVEEDVVKGDAQETWIVGGQGTRLVNFLWFIDLGKLDHDLTVLPKPGIMWFILGKSTQMAAKFRNIIYNLPSGQIDVLQ